MEKNASISLTGPNVREAVTKCQVAELLPALAEIPTILRRFSLQR